MFIILAGAPEVVPGSVAELEFRSITLISASTGCAVIFGCMYVRFSIIVIIWLQRYNFFFNYANIFAIFSKFIGFLVLWYSGQLEAALVLSRRKHSFFDTAFF